eukprot:GHVU01140612.1.p2 GENE.GHVU01140612.1~~GHVU01140612.1.p2  ORF type:complete len:261 (-),score=31.40 GHVU01140612.1:445-1227(-)
MMMMMIKGGASQPASRAHPHPQRCVCAQPWVMHCISLCGRALTCVFACARVLLLLCPFLVCVSRLQEEGESQTAKCGCLRCAGKRKATAGLNKQTWFSRKYKGVVAPADLLIVLLLAAGVAFFSLTCPDYFAALLFVFALGCWLGYLLVWGVVPALHSPLMSVSNAISGVVMVGALLGISAYAHSDFQTHCRPARLDPLLVAAPDGTPGPMWWCQQRGAATISVNSVAIAAAAINVAGGFTVTQKMLSMFRSSRTASSSK